MNWITTISENSKRLGNVIRAIGPFAISQSDKASEAYQRHLGRIAQVDFLKELLSTEIQTRGEVKKILLERFINAPADERIRIERDLEFVDGITRQVHIALKSLSYGDKTASDSTTATQEIKEHWIDKFNELARKRNEDWRSDLLARALAYETETPGTVSPRVLWLIGNMEEDLFKALSDLLNLCTWMSNTPILPNSIIKALDRADPTTGKTVGNLVFQLGDIGVVADHLTSSRTYNPGQAFTATYDKTNYLIIPKSKIEIRGILFTPLGDSIARFFSPNWNSAGQSALNDWVNSIKPEMAIVRLMPINEVKDSPPTPAI